MAIVERQNNLFAAEDWKVAYKAFSKINFQAYDFNTMRKAMVDYVKINYPENFNDFIESSEFVAIIELLAYLSTSLAFRMDLNSRENFLETAERRDSVFKLARMLGYNPKRNLPASGLMKVDAVSTTEPVQDSLGNDINNVNVFWDDANNPEAYEQFITILNSAMASYNRFSQPAKSGKVAGINTELYEINTPISNTLAFDFGLSTSGVNRNFEVINPDFLDNDVYFERHPNPTNNFNLIYQNGENNFLNSCRSSGVDGLIIVDLPYPENKKFANKCKKKSINFIQLLSPTTSRDRMKKIIKDSHDMIYYISMLSTTGGKLKVSPKKILQNYNIIKKINPKKNLVIGFGITDKTISSLKSANGLVVGSMLCKTITNSLKMRQNPVTKLDQVCYNLKKKII